MTQLSTTKAGIPFHWFERRRKSYEISWGSFSILLDSPPLIMWFWGVCFDFPYAVVTAFKFMGFVLLFKFNQIHSVHSLGVLGKNNWCIYLMIRLTVGLSIYIKNYILLDKLEIWSPLGAAIIYFCGIPPDAPDENIIIQRHKLPKTTNYLGFSVLMCLKRFTDVMCIQCPDSIDKYYYTLLNVNSCISSIQSLEIDINLRI